MTKTPRLNDLQLILLSTAAGRDNGSLLPAPHSIAGDAARIAAAIHSLLKRALAHELPVFARSIAWRDQDQDPVGIFITDAGRVAIGAGDKAKMVQAGTAPAGTMDDSFDKAPRALTKASIVLGLLLRSEGATLAEMVEATGWLPHTTRAHLTGLRKKGRAIEKTKRDGATCYRIVEAG